MSGARGELLRASLQSSGIHPDLLHRFDYLLTGMYRALAALVPSAELLPVPDPDGDWIADVVEASAQIEESKADYQAAMASQVQEEIGCALTAIARIALARR